MYLRLPERIPIPYAFLFAGTLFVLQQLEHTSLYFSACSFLCIIVATFGFNVAGGLTRPSGAYLFFFSVLTLVVGLCTKAVLGEPADSHLVTSRLTITVYLVGICSMSLSMLAIRKLSRRRPLLGSLVNDRNMYPAAIGCLAIGLVLMVATHTVARGSGTVLSALFQINRFTELGVILAVTTVARRSGGRASMDLAALFGCSVLFIVNGLLTFSKEGFFGPLACWGVAAAATGVHLRRNQIIFLALSVLFIVRYMVPYSQYGRVYNSPSFFGNIQVAERLLANIGQIREEYLIINQQNVRQNSAGSYYNQPEGILDRFQMVSVDDLLIDATETHGPIGYYPILTDIEGLVPHVFWPDKPAILWGNVYAHEAGMPISEDDFSTGISFSPLAEAFHIARWFGLLVLAPAIWIPCLILFDSLCGDVRRSPWGLLVMVNFAHIAPEQYLGGIIYASVYISFAIVFAALITGYLMPIIGQLLIGPKRPSFGISPVALAARGRQPFADADPTQPRYTEST